MKFGGVCIVTDNAPRLVEFYNVLFQKEQNVDGDHYGFSMIAVWNSGDVELSKYKNVWLSFSAPDIDSLHERLLREIPGIVIVNPPERKPWGVLFVLVPRS